MTATSADQANRYVDRSAHALAAVTVADPSLETCQQLAQCYDRCQDLYQLIRHALNLIETPADCCLISQQVTDLIVLDRQNFEHQRQVVVHSHDRTFDRLNQIDPDVAPQLAQSQLTDPAMRHIR